MKGKFTALDVASEVACLNAHIVGMRVLNIYDVDARTYIIRLSGAPAPADAAAPPPPPPPAEGCSRHSNKVALLLESGTRLHTTAFARDRGDRGLPSGFCMKLRKHCRGRRLEAVRQLGTDRVVDLRFGSGEGCHHVLLELYGSGNVVLTDATYTVVALLRTHRFDDEVSLAVKQPYPVTHSTTMGLNPSTAQLEAGAGAGAGAEAEALLQAHSAGMPQTGAALLDALTALVAAQRAKAAAATAALDDTANGCGGGGNRKRKSKARKRSTLTQLLLARSSPAFHLGGDLILHSLATAGIPAGLKLSEDDTLDLDAAALDKLAAALREAPAVYGGLGPDAPGYIYYKRAGLADADAPPDASSAAANEEDLRLYEDFSPVALAQHGKYGGAVLAHASFDTACDEYFRASEEQRLRHAALQAGAAAVAKVEKIRTDQAARVEALEEAHALTARQAAMVEQCADVVEAVCAVLASALDSGARWEEVEEYVALEQEAGNPLALAVHEMDLAHGTAVLLLEDDEQDGAAAAVAVPVDVRLSAHANARQLWAQRKTARTKAERTAAHSAVAVKKAEKDAEKKRDSVVARVHLKAAREVHWFEKFNWFVTSENYLVVGGRDTAQAELVVKRHLRPCDVYVSADVPGAAPAYVLRAKGDEAAKGVRSRFSPLALEEAGAMAACRSAAWAGKLVTSAWWVRAAQVHRTGGDGSPLPVGTFATTGRKTFLPHVQLEMGLAFMFRLGRESLAAHAEERADRAALGPEGDAESSDAEGDVEGGVEGDGGDAGDAGADDADGADVADDADDDDGDADAGDAGDADGADGADDADDNADDADDADGADDADDADDNAGDAGDAGDVDDRDAPAGGQAMRLVRDGGGQQRRGGRMSARERKLLKRAKAVNPEATIEAVRAAEEARIAARPAAAAAPALARAAAPPEVEAKKRGRKAKLKKLKGKYKDQDDDERELRMEALGHRGAEDRGAKQKKGSGSNRADAAAEASAAARTAATVALLEGDAGAAVASLPEAVRDGLERLVGGGKLGAGDVGAFEVATLKKLSEAEMVQCIELFERAELGDVKSRAGFFTGIVRRFARGEGRDGEAAAAAPAPAAAAAVPVPAAAAAAAADGAEPGDGDADLEACRLLTHKPKADDELLYAVPVCAPYRSLAQYKYRVKLVPGNGKKGKAAKQCVELLARHGEGTPKEIELIRGANEAEVVAAMVGDVKVSAPGAQAAAAKIKAAGKAKKAKKQPKRR